MYSTVTQILLSPEQFGELIRGAIREELANFKPVAPPTSDLPENLTRKESAKLLRVSLVTLNSWSRVVDDRPAIITPIRLNGRIRYKRDELLALLDHSPKHRHRR